MENQELINNLNAEKIALDQSLVAQIQSTLELRKQLIIKDQCINNMNQQIQNLMKELENVNKELEDVKKSLEDVKKSLAITEDASGIIEG